MRPGVDPSTAERFPFDPPLSAAPKSPAIPAMATPLPPIADLVYLHRGSLLDAPAPGRCHQPGQLRQRLPGPGVTCRHSADLAVEFASLHSECRLQRSAPRPRHLGGNAGLAAYGSGPMRAPARRALALLRLRPRGAPSRSAP